MKVQLVSGLPIEKRTGGEIDTLYPPLGLLYLISYCRQFINDIEWKVTDGDMLAFEKTLKEIRNFRPDVVGFSLRSMGTVGAYKLINQVKEEFPETLVIVGGPHATALPDEVLQMSKADVAVLGEGEQAFLELIQQLKSGKIELKKIKGICFRSKEKLVSTEKRDLIKDIDSIPFPAREFVDLKKYPGFVVRKNKPETYYISSRGCPHHCIFCANNIWWHQTPNVRFRSPKNILDEVEVLRNEYGMKEFYDQCDEFNVNLPWAEKVCDEFIARDLDVTWKVQMRADKVTESLAAKLAKAGCWLVSLGIESGNQETLSGVKKFISLDQVVKSCEILKRHGIKVYGLFMAFNTWEENRQLRYEGVKETRNTLKFAKSLIDGNLLDYISWSLTAPFPGSKLYDIAIRHSLIPKEVLEEKEDWNNTWRLLLNLPGVSREDWEMIKNEGAKLQTRCFLKNGNINRSLIPLYFRRGVELSKLEVKKLLGRFSS
jgi:radical SAM superfamily enzyme YgiQ (UPF0313 family)